MHTTDLYKLYESYNKVNISMNFTDVNNTNNFNSTSIIEEQDDNQTEILITMFSIILLILICYIIASKSGCLMYCCVYATVTPLPT